MKKARQVGFSEMAKLSSGSVYSSPLNLSTQDKFKGLLVDNQREKLLHRKAQATNNYESM